MKNEQKILKVYVAARAKYRVKHVVQIHNVLKKMGYQLTYDWADEDASIKKPYRKPENRKYNLKAQAKMLKAAAEADIFIFIDDPGLRGAYIELGAFLHDCLENSKDRKAYIVGPDSHEREFVFESPEYVLFCDNIDEVYQDLSKSKSSL
ncbi:MAG TPA: hypothetical protein VLF88_01035 [Candidatus Babeliales bacterium]|nr:hypothetical protein [Candidatus Babeliales bacterium]